MLIKITRDVIFWENGEKLILPVGSQLTTISENDLYKLDYDAYSALKRAQQRYEKNNVKGAFCFIKGKFRFILADYYEGIRR